jgi:ferredoxin
VVESAERLKGRALASFSELLRSGRPVQVVVIDQASGVGAGEAWESLSGYHPGLGYVAVAHREALVVQSTLGDPGHLAEGLRRMATATVPSAAFVAVPSWEATVPPWVQLAGARHGRATPCFVYDADAGATWAERFDLSGNPQPENAWPVHRVDYVDHSDAEGTLDEAFTFAHAVAADAAYRKQFRVIPARAWSDEQIELAAWLAAGEVERRRRVPFVWIVGDDGLLARAIVTRELAFACRDRRRAWRILQELAGTDNEYAHRAAEAARQQALVEAERARDELDAAHAEELARVRGEAGAEAVDRIVALLLNLDSAPIATAAPTPAPAADAPVAEAPVAEAPAEEAGVEEPEEDEVLGFDEPYITSVLCTTCQECININPRLFRYNENKQAVIADAAAGTFEQLVRAAEKCPARCIHTGVPRDDDSTATDEMIERAQRFR